MNYVRLRSNFERDEGEAHTRSILWATSFIAPIRKSRTCAAPALVRARVRSEDEDDCVVQLIRGSRNNWTSAVV